MTISNTSNPPPEIFPVFSEINEAVARKLGIPEKFLQPDPLDGRRLLKNYCGSIEMAWEVIDHFKKSDWTVLVVFDGKRWGCRLDHPKESSVVQHADTAPMAICKAFLKLP